MIAISQKQAKKMAIALNMELVKYQGQIKKLKGCFVLFKKNFDNTAKVIFSSKTLKVIVNFMLGLLKEKEREKFKKEIANAFEKRQERLKKESMLFKQGSLF
ncbi:hypothetical protein [Helicobacter pullorum]|uniref:hypothetical protein n=1 Tax=Helicobacter pullorum TaxID=35818 RepID=UPI00242BD695|nr:hypothetical protein [Helicobacter pullorum]